MKKLIATSVALFAIGFSGSVNAALTTITFDDLFTAADVTNKTQVTDQYSGVHFALEGAGAILGPTIVKCFINNSLTITPGDDTADPFWNIVITFDKPVDYFAFQSLDSDEYYSVKTYLGADAQAPFISSVAGADLQVYNYALGAIGGVDLFDKVVIEITKGALGGLSGGPEYFDNITYNPVPEPATMLLFGSGVAGLAGLRRKMKKS